MNDSNNQFLNETLNNSNDSLNNDLTESILDEPEHISLQLNSKKEFNKENKKNIKDHLNVLEMMNYLISNYVMFHNNKELLKDKLICCEKCMSVYPNYLESCNCEEGLATA